MAIGVLDDRLNMDDLLRPDVNYERPPRGGAALFGLLGDLRGKRILDHGCGAVAPYRSDIEKTGATWIGVDLTGSTCSVAADGYRLPFRDGSFDGVFSCAVLEHLLEPRQALEEMWRVIAPGGILFGYITFLEHFHGLSYFHMSHMGLEYLLLSTGFQPKHIYASHAAPSFLLEHVLFTKPVPVLQPLLRAVLRGTMSIIMALNRLGREIVVLLRREPAAVRRKQRRQYRQLQALRFAVGFNFIATRTETPATRPSGYRLVRQQSTAPSSPTASRT